jgi:lipopolysaccharide exporter
MSTFLTASRGVGWMIATQAIVGVGQFAYSAVTARIFTPAEFGSFAAALALQALLILLTTTGLPSLILRETALTKTDVAWIRFYALVGGVLAATLFLLLGPYWILLLGAPDGTQFFGLLAVALVLGPLAAVEASLLRRESRPGADSTTFLLAFTISALAAIAVALSVREAWALALVTVLNPVVLGASSALLRKTRWLEQGTSRHGRFLGFAWKVSAQNVVFLLIGQSPAWVLSATLGAAALGNYSRASTLLSTPAASLLNAINRAVQPHWRKLSEAQVISMAMRDVTVLTSNLTFSLFAVLAVLGPNLAAIWLGPGWGVVGELVPWLAIAFAVQVPFTVLVTSLEMRSRFTIVRLGQVGQVAGLLVGLGLFIFTGDAHMAAAAAALSQVTGFVMLLAAMRKSSHLTFGSLFWAAGLPALWGFGVAVVAWAGLSLSHLLSWRLLGSLILAEVAAGAALALVFWAVTFRWQPASAILSARGIRLPKILAGNSTTVMNR